MRHMSSLIYRIPVFLIHRKGVYDEVEQGNATDRCAAVCDYECSWLLHLHRFWKGVGKRT